MRVSYCTPFKPLDHPRLSGDVTIARDLHDFLVERGHETLIPPQLQTQWIWRRPANWWNWFAQKRAAKLHCRAEQPDAWLTYHSYYKAPDILGPIAKAAGIPYAIFAGSYAEKRRTSWKTKGGYLLNKKALETADHVFTNKKRDIEPLSRVVPPEKLSFVAPGIRTEKFPFDAESRESLRDMWHAKGKVIVLTAAMLRPGVKAEGVEHVINACARLSRKLENILLLVAGDGPEKERLQALAQQKLGNNVRFLGLVDRWKLFKVYSAADLFAFPGINEGLGMVYLEAQCAGLPVVAWDHDGAPEVVEHGKTGIITPSFDEAAFAKAIGALVKNASARRDMSDAARTYVATTHNLQTNYAAVEKKLLSLSQAAQG